MAEPEKEKDETVEMPAEIVANVSGERWGRFIRHRKLGGGASHETWQAWDTERGQWVALRILAGASPAERETAARAGKAASGISDPRVLAATGAGVQSGRVWIARPYVEGLNLAALPWQDARTLAGIAREVLEALDAARAAGRAHGRISAGNVLVASREEKGSGWRHAVSVSEIGITPGNGAADLRAAGEMFGELLGVRARKAGGTGDTTRAAPVAGGGADPELAAILTRCFKKKTSAAEAARDLAAWLGKRPAPAPRAKRPKLPVAIAVAVLLLAGAWGAWRWQRGRAFGADVAAAERAAREERFGDAREHLRRALGRRPGDSAAAARLAEIEKALAQKENIEAAARAEAQRAGAARAALAKSASALDDAVRYAGRPDATRAELDRLLGPAIEEAELAVRTAPGLPESWDALAAALDLAGDEPGGTSPWTRLAALRASATPPAWNSPVPARDSLRRWVLETHGPRGRFMPAPERSDAWTRLRLGRAALRTSGDAEPFSAGEVAAAQLTAVALASPGGPETAWFALFRLDAPAAADAARAALRAGAGLETASMHAVLGLAEPERAEEHFTEALRIRPWDALFLFERARARQVRGDFKGALADLDRAAALHPHLPDLLPERALARLETGDLAGAEGDAAEALRRNPGDAAALVVTAHLRRERGDMKGAVEAGEGARAREPRMVGAWLIVALCRAESRDVSGLAPWCTSAIELDPGRAESYAIRACARLAGGDVDGALADCDAALALDPGCWEARLRRAQVRSWQKKFDEGIADCDEAARQAPGRALPVMMRGSLRVMKGDAEGALVDGRAAVAINPGSAESWGVVAMALQSLRRSEEAVVAFDRALEVRPLYLAALLNRGIAKMELGRSAEAIADFRSATKLWPDRVDAYFELGEALHRTGDTRAALEVFTAAIDIDPGHEGGWLRRAILRSTSTDLDGAISDATRALECRGDLPEAFMARGYAYRCKHDYAAAIADCERAAALTPDEAPARVMLGDVKMEMEDLPGAIGAYSDAIRVDPGYVESWERRCIARLRAADPSGALADAADMRKRGRVATGWYYEGEAWRQLKSAEKARAAYGKAVAAAGEGDPIRVLAEKAMEEMREGK